MTYCDQEIDIDKFERCILEIVASKKPNITIVSTPKINKTQSALDNLKSLLKQYKGDTLFGETEHSDEYKYLLNHFATFFSGISIVPMRVFLSQIIGLVKFMRTGSTICMIAHMILYLRKINEIVPITIDNVSRFMIGTLKIARDVYEDIPVYASQYAILVGLDLAEIKDLVLLSLIILRYNVHVKKEDILPIVNQIRQG